MHAEMQVPQAYPGWVVMTKAPTVDQVGSIFMPTKNVKQSIGVIVSASSAAGVSYLAGEIVAYQARAAVKVTSGGVDYVMVKTEDVCARMGVAVDDGVDDEADNEARALVHPTPRVL